MEDQSKEAFFERVQQGLESREEAEGTKTETPGAPSQGKSESGVNFSTLEVRDRVVVMLLYNQVVRVDHVEDVWDEWKRQPDSEPSALWRLLAEHPEVDASEVFREAARVYAFEEALISRYSVMSFLREHRGHFTDEQWQRMCDIALVPIAFEYGEQEGRQWVFATHDPMHPRLGALLRQLDVEHYKLKHAPEVVVRSLLAEVFPDHEHPLTDVDRDKLEAYYARSRRDAEVSSPEALQQQHFLRKALEEDPDPNAEGEQGAPTRSDRETALDFFERILTEGVRAEATKIYFFPNADQQTEVHFGIDGELEEYTFENDLPAEFLLTYIKNEILERHRTMKAEPVTERYGQRWIDGNQVRYKVSVNKVRDREREIRTELVVLHILE